MRQQIRERDVVAGSNGDPASLATIERSVQDANSGLALILGKQRLHGEHLERIIELVTPDEKEEGEGPSLEELLGGLVTRLDNQSAYLKDILVGLARITRDMPLDVVQAIADNFGIDPIPVQVIQG
ncbi:MAG: hypothetical protein ACRYG8_53900 [Janthinobacterium lividum]